MLYSWHKRNGRLFFFILISFLFSHICHLMFRIKQISQYPPLIYSWLWSSSGKECFPVSLWLPNSLHPIEMSLSGNSWKWVKGIALSHVVSLQVHWLTFSEYWKTVNFPYSLLIQGLISFVTLSMLFQVQRGLGAQHVSTQSSLKSTGTCH